MKQPVYTKEQQPFVEASAIAATEYVYDRITFEDFQKTDIAVFEIDKTDSGETEAIKMRESREKLTRTMRKAADTAVALGQPRELGIMMAMSKMNEMEQKREAANTTNQLTGLPYDKKETLH